MAIDPVCGKLVSEEKHGISYRGKVYFFCSDTCRKKFEDNPKEYAK